MPRPKAKPSRSSGFSKRSMSQLRKSMPDPALRVPTTVPDSRQRFFAPQSLAYDDKTGSLYVGEIYNGVRMINASGNVAYYRAPQGQQPLVGRRAHHLSGIDRRRPSGLHHPRSPEQKLQVYLAGKPHKRRLPRSRRISGLQQRFRIRGRSRQSSRRILHRQHLTLVVLAYRNSIHARLR